MTNEILAPKEFDIIKTNVGYTMNGWDFTSAEIDEATTNDRMLNPAYELMSNTCPWNCFFCFTEDPARTDSKKRLPGEMSLEQILSLIDESHELGARTINIIGAGEPTIDPHFWDIVEHISAKGITPIVYTEGALRLTNPDFAQRLYETGATVVLKVNSLENETYQNATVTGGKERVVPLKKNYFQERNKALKVLLKTGFNKHDPTRLAFDTIICQENYDEMLRLHRYARDNNIFVLAVNYLPSGRSLDLDKIQNAVLPQEQVAIYNKMARIDKEDYGIEHASKFPYGGGTPCSIRGRGLYVKIQGDVLMCPGEVLPVGNLKNESLKSIWEKTKEERMKHNWACPPRIREWLIRGYDTKGLE